MLAGRLDVRLIAGRGSRRLFESNSRYDDQGAVPRRDKSHARRRTRWRGNHAPVSRVLDAEPIILVAVSRDDRRCAGGRGDIGRRRGGNAGGKTKQDEPQRPRRPQRKNNLFSVSSAPSGVQSLLFFHGARFGVSGLVAISREAGSPQWTKPAQPTTRQFPASGATWIRLHTPLAPLPRA